MNVKSIKSLAEVILPGYASLYFLLSYIWDFPAVKQVLGILAIIAFIFGLTLEVASRRADGQIVIKEDTDGKKTFMLEINKNPEDLQYQEIVTFKVTNESSPGYDSNFE